MGRAWLGTIAFSTLMMVLLGNDDDNFLDISGGYGEEGFKQKGRENVMPQYTLRIGKVMLPYKNIPGLAIPLAIIGNLNDAIKMGEKTEDITPRLIASMFTKAFMQSVVMVKDMSFVEGTERLLEMLSNVISMRESDFTSMCKNIAKQYIGFMSRPLPQNINLIQQIWKMFDPTSYSQKDIKSILAYAAGIQHFVNYPSIDQLGDEVQTYPGETLLPYTHWMGLKGKDPRWEFLAKHNAIPVKIYNRAMRIETEDLPEKRKLTEEELHDYSKRTGELFSKYLNEYRDDTEKVAERMEDKIEVEKANGETETISGVQEDVEKLWKRAKDDAETELFWWGIVKEEMPDTWALIKKHKAYQPYATSKYIDKIKLDDG